MMYIPCPSQVKLSPPHIVNLGIVCPRISIKNRKMCPESAKIVWRKRKRHRYKIHIPYTDQINMFKRHTEYLGMGGTGISAKNEKIHHKSAKIAQRKGKRHPSMMYIPCPSQVKLSPPHIVNLGIVCPRISAKETKTHPKSNFLLCECQVQ